MNTATKGQPVGQQERPKTLDSSPTGAEMVVADGDHLAGVTGAYRQAGGISQRLRWAEMHCILVAPATSCPSLMEGCSVSLAAVNVDPEKDTHDVGFGKRSLLKHAVYAIANAAGVRFDTKASGRIDDGRDPRYVHWRAVGAWQHLDGTVLPIVGDKEMDLRDGSDQVTKILESAKDEETGRKQLRDMRSFILAHAQTKAELRAIRKALGLRSYTPDELQRPFLVARLTFDGRSDNPEIARENARAIRNLMLGGARALFGAPAAEALGRETGSELPALRAHPAPPVGSVPADGDDDGDPDTIVHQAEPEPPPVRTAPVQAEMATPMPHPADESFAPPAGVPSKPRASGRAGSREPTMRFGNAAGTTFADAADRDLEWYGKALEKSIGDPSKSQYKATNERDLAALRAEQAKRKAQPLAATPRVVDDPYGHGPQATGGDKYEDAPPDDPDSIPF